MIIGNGVDIIEVRRLQKAVEKWGDEFLNRLFTKKELENAKGRVALYEHLAGRFAAKEAIAKALGDKNIGWHDVEISNDNEGRPICTILSRKNAYKKLYIHISISHIKDYAVASAVITKKG